MDNNEFVLPAPGLSGDYRGFCVVCLRGTDTAMGVTGVAEVTVTAGVALGIPIEQVTAMFGWTDHVPDGVVTRYFFLCTRCCPAALPVGLYPDEVPVITAEI